MRFFGKGKCELFVQNFGMGKCKLIANFSAIMMPSLPSISLSLSLSPSVPRAQYRKRFRASYIVREVRSVRERDTERQTEVTSPLSR